MNLKTLKYKQKTTSLPGGCVSVSERRPGEELCALLGAGGGGAVLVIYNVLPLCDFWECHSSLEVSSEGSGSAGPDVGDWSSGGRQWCQVSETKRMSSSNLSRDRRQTQQWAGL